MQILTLKELFWLLNLPKFNFIDVFFKGGKHFVYLSFIVVDGSGGGCDCGDEWMKVSLLLFPSSSARE